MSDQSIGGPLKGVVLIAGAVLMSACMNAITRNLSQLYAVSLIMAWRWFWALRGTADRTAGRRRRPHWDGLHWRRDRRRGGYQMLSRVLDRTETTFAMLFQSAPVGSILFGAMVAFL